MIFVSFTQSCLDLHGILPAPDISLSTGSIYYIASWEPNVLLVVYTLLVRWLKADGYVLSAQL